MAPLALRQDSMLGSVIPLRTDSAMVDSLSGGRMILAPISAQPVRSVNRIIGSDHARVGAWMKAQGSAAYRDGSTCIGLEHNGEIVAGALFDFCNGASIFAHIAITGRITREWLWFICYYPFVQLRCRVVIGLVPSENKAARRFDEHFGFRLQTTIAGADLAGDLCIYTLKKEDCRFLTRGAHG